MWWKLGCMVVCLSACHARYQEGMMTQTPAERSSEKESHIANLNSSPKLASPMPRSEAFSIPRSREIRITPWILTVFTAA